MDREDKGTRHFGLVVNLTIPGSQYFARAAILKAAGNVQCNAKISALFILFPNTGTHGDTFDDDATAEAEPEIRQHLSDHALGPKQELIILVFGEASTPSQITRPGQMFAFMVQWQIEISCRKNLCLAAGFCLACQ